MAQGTDFGEDRPLWTGGKQAERLSVLSATHLPAPAALFLTGHRRRGASSQLAETPALDGLSVKKG